MWTAEDVGRSAFRTVHVPVAGTVRVSARIASRPQSPDTVLSLREVLERLRRRSPEYRAALASADAVGLDVWRSWGAFLPRVTAGASFFQNEFTNRTFLDPTGVSRELENPVESTSKTASQSLSFQWTALEGGRRFFDLGASRARARTADLAASATLLGLEVQAERQYWETLKQQELTRLARELVEARRRDLEIARARFRIAAVSQTDVLQAELEVGRQEVAALRAEQAADAARRELSAIIGLDEDRAYRLADTTVAPPDITEFDVDALLARARRSHPDLARFEAQVDADRDALWAARGSWLPDVSLGLSLSRSEQLGPQGDLFTFDPRNTSTSFSLSLSWPILSGLRKRWETGQASARLSESRHQRRARELELEKEVRNAYEAAVAAARTLELQERNAELAREAVRLATERYRIGAASYVELQQATIQATAAERELIDARYELRKSLATLKGAVGSPLPETSAGLSGTASADGPRP